MNKRQLLIYLISALATIAIGTFIAVNLGWSGASSADEKLKVAIELNELKPLQIRQYYPDKKYVLGQALFFDPILSGNRNMSCASCHLLSKGLSDGRPFSIGPNEGHFSRELTQTSIEQGVRKRNAPDLWNRDANPVKNLFLDGRIEVLDSERKLFRSPLGDLLPKQFKNALEVQAIFPLVAESEMSGLYGDVSDKSLPTGHANKKNDLIVKSNYGTEKEKILSIHTQLLERLLSKNGKPEAWQVTYRNMFKDAYPTVKPEELTIYHVGSAIGHFEELAFAANNSRWDQYLEGKTDALNSQEKLGALVFYGKGYCSACHTGTLLSDFKFYNIGVISDPLTTSKGQFEDLGRYFATRDMADMYKFRTPPLRNITKSAPYFHDGSSVTLKEALNRHANPLKYADAYKEDGGVKMEKKHIDAISPVLLNMPKMNDEEIANLEAFLKTLESQSRVNADIFPEFVPSGLPVGPR